MFKPFRVGDRVVNTHNDYSGRIEEVNGNEVLVRYFMTHNAAWQPVTSIVHVRDWDRHSHFARTVMR